MLIYSSDPIIYKNGKVQIPLRPEDISDDNVYEEVYALFDDNPETDVYRLLQQKRLSK